MDSVDSVTEDSNKPNMIIIHLENCRDPKTLSNNRMSEARKKYPWSPAEEEALLKGVHRHGEGKWQVILNSSEAFHPSRSSVDLKDKFRLLNRMSSYYTLDKQLWYEVLEDDTVGLDAFGKPRVVSTRFPHDAAKAFSNASLKNTGEVLVVRVAKREEKSVSKIHIYNIAMVDGIRRISKQRVVYTRRLTFVD